MSNVPTNLLYSKEHEWLLIEGDKAMIGITDYAQKSLGDVVFVELPAINDVLQMEQTFGVVESTKAVSDIYSPIEGEIIEVNENVLENPELINSSPYQDGWLVKVKVIKKQSNLMDATAYKKYTEEE